ncbi:MAG: hypothetical protein KGH90_12085 [Xanthomonadaceae bacterium]|nr:hypothetical protein [Xanthomonadaceae bacterium]
MSSWQHRWALLLALLLHAVFVVLVGLGMRTSLPRPAVATAPVAVMQVRFITLAPPAQRPPPPALLPPPVPPKRREPPARGALVVVPPPVPRLLLYDAQGQPRLPAAAASAPVAAYVQRMPAGDTQIMRHRSAVTYRPTRFAKDWTGGGDAIDNALQKLVDRTTVSRTVRLPGGIRIHCGVSLAMLAGGCRGEPPPPPSAKDGDARLNMAPARSLDGLPHGPRPPGVAACIAMYRAGKPLAYGCPVDTPSRAVDAGHRARAANENGGG